MKYYRLGDYGCARDKLYYTQGKLKGLVPNLHTKMISCWNDRLGKMQIWSNEEGKADIENFTENNLDIRASFLSNPVNQHI